MSKKYQPNLSVETEIRKKNKIKKKINKTELIQS